MIRPEEHINFHGQDWNNIKLYLNSMLDKKIGLLVQESTHDKSNQIRGAISVIREVLALKKASPRDANRG